MKNISIIILFLSAFLISGCTSKTEETYSIAENFKLPDVNRAEHALSDFKADIIMLHFWADWCAHCREEFKGLEKTYQDLKSEGFLIIAVNVGQSKDHVKGIQEEYHITFPMLRDADKKELAQYDKAGNLVATGHIASDSVGIAPFVKELRERGLEVTPMSGVFVPE